MILDPVKNFAIVTVSTGYAAGATSIVLSSGDGAKLPAPSTDGAFNLVWYNSSDYPNPADDPNVEIVRCTGRSTDTLTVTRAQEGTADVNHNTGGKTYKMLLSITKKMIDDIKVGGLTWAIVSTTATAVPGGGYICDTSGAAFPLTLPASPAAGDVVAICDAASTFNTKNLTIGRNSLKIMGLAEDMTVSTKNAAFRLIYSDSTNGWRIA